jgi:hypothetical protein
MPQPDVALELSEERDAAADEDGDSCNDKLLDQTLLKKFSYRLAAVNIEMPRAAL